MYSDVPVLIHIGPHKTGTTWLQKSLLPYAEGIVYDGNMELSHAAFLIPRIDELSVEKALSIFSPLLEKARETKKPLVISDEALGGRPFGQRFLQEIAAERIAKTVPHAHILVTTREQNSIILSMYGEYIRYGYSSNLESFLEQESEHKNIQPLLDLKYYEWDRFVEIYESHFPAEQILAIPMEWGLKASQNYTSAIEKFLGASLDVSVNTNVKAVQRGSLSGWALETVRQFNKLHPQDSRHLNLGGKFSPGAFGYQINRITPDFARKRQKQRMQKIVRDTIGSRFIESIRRFQTKIDLSLKDLGYEV